MQVAYNFIREQLKICDVMSLNREFTVKVLDVNPKFVAVSLLKQVQYDISVQQNKYTCNNAGAY